MTTPIGTTPAPTADLMATAALLPLILQGDLDDHALAGQVVIVTGAGGGIGFEAARSLLLLGASVVIAEIDSDVCSAAVELLSAHPGPGYVIGFPIDVSDEVSVRKLVKAVTESFGKIDAVVNNATFAPAGAAVVETPVEVWDRSYSVNLRGPALLARACLPAMIERGRGVFVCVSSTGGPFLAPYETLKAAQLALANSLDAELADAGVIAFTIGPGLVPTPTAVAAIQRIAPRLGTTVEEFWRANGGAVVSVEAAGAGFAAAVAMAGRYAGQEISSTQALIDARISIPDGRVAESPAGPQSTDLKPVVEASGKVLKTLREQAEGWKTRSFFERQWMMRDFKQRVGVPVERCVEMLMELERNATSGNPVVAGRDASTFKRLAGFYAHLGELAAGYVKDPAQRQEQVAITAVWVAEVESLVRTLPQHSA
jgi:NAD(P)-dependent dehydrogenase (short-subunit alcohol dehydrogenase family)